MERPPPFCPAPTMRAIIDPFESELWDESQKIPLGYTPESETIIYKPLTTLSDTFFWFARPGIGKTVVMKLVVFYLWLSGRPIIIFDPTGMDHRLSYKPNTYPKNLPPDMKPMGMNVHPQLKTKVKYLNVSDNRFNWEQKYAPNINNLSHSELKSFGFSDGAADFLRKILINYGPFQNFDDLVDFIAKFPINPNTARSYAAKARTGKTQQITKHHTFYKEGEYMNSNTKGNLERSLFKIIESRLLSLNDEDEFDVLEWIQKGNSVVISFNRNYELARAMLSRVSTQIINWKVSGGYGIQPWLIFEEMDQLLPRYPKESEKEVVEHNTELVNQLRKLSLGVAGSSASILKTSLTPIENAHNKMYGQMKGRAPNLIKYLDNEFISNQVKTLHWNRYRNEREFLYVNEFGNSFKIIPFESPCEIHREFRKKKEEK